MFLQFLPMCLCYQVFPHSADNDISGLPASIQTRCSLIPFPVTQLGHASYSLTSPYSSRCLLTLHVLDLRDNLLASWSLKSHLEMRNARDDIFEIFPKIPSGELLTSHYGGLGILILHYVYFKLS